MIVFLRIALISKRFELQMPDWSQIKYNSEKFTVVTNLAPVMQPFENKRQNIDKNMSFGAATVNNCFTSN